MDTREALTDKATVLPIAPTDICTLNIFHTFLTKVESALVHTGMCCLLLVINKEYIHGPEKPLPERLRRSYLSLHIKQRKEVDNGM